MWDCLHFLPVFICIEKICCVSVWYKSDDNHPYNQLFVRNRNFVDEYCLFTNNFSRFAIFLLSCALFVNQGFSALYRCPKRHILHLQISIMQQDNYLFRWSDLGDIELGRPTLGNTTFVTVYRMMKFSLHSSISERFGGKVAQKIFYRAGEMAGKEFCTNMLDKSLDACAFFDLLARKLDEFNIGIMKVEHLDDFNRNYTVTIEEDLDCSGLKNTGETVCGFDEGFIGGVLQEYMGVSFLVKEIDCWAEGAKLCRFEIKKSKP